MRLDPTTTVTSYLSPVRSTLSLSNPLILIPTFENPDYLKNTLSQFEKWRLSHVVILDGGSFEEEMTTYLDSLTKTGLCVIRLVGNPGPKWCWEDKDFYSALPQVFCVTDPDLSFSSTLPDNFIETLFGLTEEFHIGKAGFALTLSDEIDDSEFFWGRRFHTVHSWEAKFWETPLRSTANVEAYLAEIDTTFAVYNKRFFDPSSPLRAIRVAGDFAAKHIPWFPALREGFRRPPARGAHSSWAHGNEILLMREALSGLESELSALKASLSWRATRPFRFLLDRVSSFVSRLRRLAPFQRKRFRRKSVR